MMDSSELRRRRRRGRELAAAADAAATASAPDVAPPAVFVAGTFNLDLLPPLLTEALERHGVPGLVRLGDFGQLAQLLLAPDSKLYAAAPQRVVLVVATEDLLLPLFERPTACDVATLINARLTELQAGLDALRSRLPTTVCYLATLGSTFAPAEAILDPASSHGGLPALRRWNQSLAALVAERESVVLIDADRYRRESGFAATIDERLWYAARMRLNEPGLAELADVVARHAAAYAGRTHKVAVVDLDNTLWGGVVGEIGWEHVQLGNEGVGLAYQDFQRELLKWHDQGVLLAACSKNNPADAWQVFERHPEMILRREHLAASAVNWTDKATNLRQLSAELNLSLDSFIFFDDNPVERTWIRQAAPGVLVAELPDDPALRPAYLRRSGYFARLRVTAEDARRTELYQAEKSRVELKAGAATVADFLRSLEQRLSLEPLSAGTGARAAQLCQRTNQFNFTGRRYVEAELDALRSDPQAAVFVLRLADRFGDHGIIGLAVLEFAAREAELTSFLLSCRVLGRRVEHAVLAALGDFVKERGATTFAGRFVPTPKNTPAAEFLAAVGLVRDAAGRFVVEAAEAAACRTPEIEVEWKPEDAEPPAA